MLDEPTIGLDPVQIQEIRALIKELGQEHTVILSTHILPEVTMTCDRAVIIHRGKVTADGSLSELARKVGGPRRITVRLAEPDGTVAARLGKLAGVTKVEATSTPGRFAVHVAEGTQPANEVALEVLNAGWGLVEIADEVPSLEEVFVRMTS
ncbi:MAG: DUF4162 domain-containing protein [Deltaproteobacteria bacterium]|nr:DUF4162 domain-containing protein [Deltaproteobacteria bacterium]